MTDDIERHHASRLTAKVIEDNPHRVLQTWIDGLDDEATDKLVDSIYGAVCDEIAATLNQPVYEADMDNRIDTFSLSDRSVDNGTVEDRGDHHG